MSLRWGEWQGTPEQSRPSLEAMIYCGKAWSCAGPFRIRTRGWDRTDPCCSGFRSPRPRKLCRREPPPGRRRVSCLASLALFFPFFLKFCSVLGDWQGQHPVFMSRARDKDLTVTLTPGHGHLPLPRAGAPWESRLEAGWGGWRMWAAGLEAQARPGQAPRGMWLCFWVLSQLCPAGRQLGVR